MHASVLRYLETVARLGSIRRAAQVLNVASSAVNRQILKLEGELGGPLFERRRDGVRLSQAGELLLRHVRGTLSDYRRTRSEIAALTGQIVGEIKLITIRPLIDRFLPGPVNELSRQHPGIRFRIASFDPAETGEKADITSYDLAIIFTEGRTVDHAVITKIRTKVGLILPPAHPLAARKKVTLADCAGFQVLTLDDLWFQHAVSETKFAKRGGRLAFRVIANSLPLLQSAILAGLGIGIFTPVGFMDELLSGQLKYVPLTERFGESEISLVVPHHQQLSVPARMLAEMLTSRFREMQEKIGSVGG